MENKPNIQNVILIACGAGDILMSYRGKVQADYKSDQSPVTKADHESSDFVIKHLQSLTPDIPVISEEGDMALNSKIVKKHDTYWLCDPLDGTKTYINGHDGFGVHIALIHRGEPVMGVAYFPAQENGQGKIYYTGNNGGAYVRVGQNAPQRLYVKTAQSDVRLSLGWADKPMFMNFEMVRAVGGARLCVVAEGQANVAQFNAPFSYWDVAAGHAIIKAAGGGFYNLKTGQEIRYDHPSLVTPPALGGHKTILKKLIQNKPPTGPRF